MLKFATGAILTLVIWQSSVQAQSTPQPIDPSTDDISVRLVEEFVQVSRLPGVYENLLKNLHTAAVIDAEARQQKSANAAPSTISEPVLVKALMPHVALITAAGVDLQTGFAENRAALIADAADLVKLVLTEAQQQKLLAFLQLNGVRKIFDVFYNLVEPPANWTEQDSKAFARFSVLADTLKAAMPDQFTIADSGVRQASPERIAAAKAVIADALAVTRFADMRNSIMNFVKEVALPLAEGVMDNEGRSALEGIAAFADIASGTHDELADSGSLPLASMLGTEQLRELHDFVKSDSARKISEQLHKIISLITAITADEINEIQAFMKDPELFSALEMPPETVKLIEAQSLLLGTKWLFTLSESITPETRDKLLAAWISMNMQASPN